MGNKQGAKRDKRVVKFITPHFINSSTHTTTSKLEALNTFQCSSAQSMTSVFCFIFREYSNTSVQTSIIRYHYILYPLHKRLNHNHIQIYIGTDSWKRGVQDNWLTDSSLSIGMTEVPWNPLISHWIAPAKRYKTSFSVPIPIEWACISAKDYLVYQESSFQSTLATVQTLNILNECSFYQRYQVFLELHNNSSHF